MIQTFCTCGQPIESPETEMNQPRQCPQCGTAIRFICAEQLPDGGGAADFDARLGIETTAPGGPPVGQHLYLGGVPEITIGKLPDKHIQLPGQRVSRFHCKLVRRDFGPSRWAIVDNHSTNGLLVNGQRVTEHELQNGDVIRIGEYQIRYSYAVAPEPALAGQGASGTAHVSGAVTSSTAEAVGPPRRDSTGGPICPSCETSLSPKTRICIQCGIHVPSGRPLLTAQGLDEDAVEVNSRNVVQFLSYIIWVTPLPIPVASEAFGTKKPIAIWTITALTCLFSLAFFFYQRSGDDEDRFSFDRPGKNLMLWHPNAKQLMVKQNEELRKQLLQMRSRSRRVAAEISEKDIDRLLESRIENAGEFHVYQLITHAFLHDTSSIYGFAMHLGGNLLFLIVFGGRVNALLGNLATAIVYPILALASAAAQIFLGQTPGPMLGASGAIMGLAGMYLILFPVHRVFCAMWIRIGRWPNMYGMKVFALRGFWVLGIYFAYDILMNFIEQHLLHKPGGVAHWAHMGGFLTGMIVAIALLMSRLANARGADILSVALGRYAWPLIGKPSSRRTDQVRPPMAPPVPGLVVTRYPVTAVSDPREL